MVWGFSTEAGMMEIQLERIETRKIYARVTDQILELVKNGSLGPGDQLPSEVRMAEQLGVGRSSVREALRALEILGIVESRSGIGSFVKRRSLPSAIVPGLQALTGKGTPLEILEARKAIEPQIAYLAALQRSEDDLEALERTVDLMEREVAKGGGRGTDEDLQIHMLLASACKNPMLIDVFRLVKDRMLKRFWRVVTIEDFSTRERMVAYVAHHREILSHLQRREAAEAAAVMLRHLEAVEAALEE